MVCMHVRPLWLERRANGPARWRLFAGLPLLVLAGAVSAAPADGACKTRDRSQHVAIVICAPDTPRTSLPEAGKSACAGLSPCNAWIWEDVAAAPARAPSVDTEMPKSATGKARAVWNDATATLMELRRSR